MWCKIYIENTRTDVHNKWLDLPISPDSDENISAVVDSNIISGLQDTYVCVCKSKNIVIGYKVLWMGKGCTRLGMWYKLMDVEKVHSQSFNVNELQDANKIIFYVIITACVMTRMEKNPLYAAFSSNWHVRDMNGLYKLPLLCPQLFSMYTDM